MRMLSTTNAIRVHPPSYWSQTVGSSSRIRKHDTTNAVVTRTISEISSVSVPTGMKTLNKRIIQKGRSDKVNYTRDGGPSFRIERPHRAETCLPRLPCDHAGGRARTEPDAAVLQHAIRQRCQRQPSLR